MVLHRRRHGLGGVLVPGWLALHFPGEPYQLGRLQFQRLRLGGTRWWWIACWAAGTGTRGTAGSHSAPAGVRLPSGFTVRILSSEPVGDGVNSVHAEYAFPDAAWTHAFLARPMTKEQFEEALVGGKWG